MCSQKINGYKAALSDALSIVDRSPFLFRMGKTYKHTINRERMIGFFTFLLNHVEVVAYHGKETEFLCTPHGFVMVSEPHPIDGRWVEDYATGIKTIINKLTEWQGRLIKADMLAVIQHLREV